MKKTNEKQSYQELKQSLDDVLVKLQQPDTDIDEAVVLHAEGQKILSKLDAYLKKVSETSEIDIKKAGS